MSVSKLLSRIVTPDSVDYLELNGIASEPLILFACTLSALTHDVDHSGVPNTQLVKENVEISKAYGGKSVAEQNFSRSCLGLVGANVQGSQQLYII